MLTSMCLCVPKATICRATDVWVPSRRGDGWGQGEPRRWHGGVLQLPHGQKTVLILVQVQV